MPIDPGTATLASGGISALGQLLFGGPSGEETENIRARTGLTKAQTERLRQLMKQSGISFDMLPGLEKELRAPIDKKAITDIGPLLNQTLQPTIRGLTQKFNARFGASSPHAAGAVATQVARQGAGYAADLYGSAYRSKLSNVGRIYSGRLGLAS